MSPTTNTVTASRKHGDLSNAGLVDIRVHVSLMALEIHVN